MHLVASIFRDRKLFYPTNDAASQNRSGEPSPRFSAQLRAALRKCLVRSTVPRVGGRSPRSLTTTMNILRHAAYLVFLISTSQLTAQDMRWDAKLQGYVIVMNPTVEKAAATALRSPPTNIVTKVLKSTNEFAFIELHTDVKILSVEGETEQNEPIILCAGKITYLTEGPFSGKMRSLAGLPGTRLNISPLATNKQELHFLGKFWSPKADKPAVILITTNEIQVLNVEITDKSDQTAEDAKQQKPIDRQGYTASSSTIVACQANLRQLDEAKRRWSTDNKKALGDTTFASHVVDYLPSKEMPKCPGGGEYRLNVVGERPRCSIHGSMVE